MTQESAPQGPGGTKDMQMPEPLGGNRDVPYEFGNQLSSDNMGPFKFWQFARLLILKSKEIKGDTEE